MTTLNLSNVRLILDSYSRMSNNRLFGISSSFDVRDGFSTVYSITEERYKISENYKIGVVGNDLLGTYGQDFYQSDLEDLIEKSENPHAGFFEIVDAKQVFVGDLISIPVTVKDSDKVLFEIPYLVVAIENGNAFVKSAIELFQEPVKKTFFDFIKQNQYWDCQKVDLCDITQKFKKLDTKLVMPGYQHEDEDAA